MMLRSRSGDRRCWRGQSSIEYALVIAIVVAALVGMQLVMRAHLSGAWRGSLDEFGHGHQYEPGKTQDTYDAHKDQFPPTFQFK